MEQLLSTGALTQILEGGKPANPVLQIIGYKPMAPDQAGFGQATGEVRYRLMIGDGVRAHQYCIITNQDLVQDIQSGKLEKWSIVRVTSYHTVDTESQADNKKKLMYILNLEIVKSGNEVGRKLNVAGDQQQQQNQPGNNLNQPGNNYNQQANNFNQPQPPMQHQSPMRPQPFHDRQPTQVQPYPMDNHDMMGQTRPMRSSHDNVTVSIAELSPYASKWVIKGRVTAKSAVREYTNAKGAGKLFNFTIADKTGEIKVTAFNADCERVFAYVEPNKVYVLGRATVKVADKRYTTADFEITLNSDSLLEEVTDASQTNDVPLAKFNFIPLGQLADAPQPPTHPVDLIGAILSISDVSSVISKTKNRELKKRNITIVDRTRHTISVTIWGDQADTFAAESGDVFVTKAARIGTYGGKSASAGDCFFVNPDIPEVRMIKNWYANLLDQNFTNLTSSQDSRAGGDQWKTLSQLLDMAQAKILLSSGQNSALYAKCKAMLTVVGKNPVYKCCPTEGCGKKLTDTQNGEMKCEKCQQTYTTCKYRYMTSVEIEDVSSSAWVTVWDQNAESLFDMKPEVMERYMKMEDKEQYDKVINRPNFKFFIFTMRVRIDSYNNEEKVRLNVVNVAPLEPISYAKRITEEIKLYSEK